MENIIIRSERKEYREHVEFITREAFWNIYEPGCGEHYLVQIMRAHEDFIKELDFVAEIRGHVVGNIMYTKATLTDEEGQIKPILTFGPLTVDPKYQRKGVGKALMEHSFKKAKELGYDTVVIYGDPNNYVSSGFKSCLKYQVQTKEATFPAAMLVKELVPGALQGKKWQYQDSPLFHFDMEKARQYDETLPPKEKGFKPSQEAFYIMSHALLK